MIVYEVGTCCKMETASLTWLECKIDNLTMEYHLLLAKGKRILYFVTDQNVDPSQCLTMFSNHLRQQDIQKKPQHGG